MLIISKIIELRTQLSEQKRLGKSIVLVPTMGNLHTGHLKLVIEAQSKGDFVVATIFVNPLQFGTNEDLGTYPRTIAEDQQRLAELGCNCLFAPEAAEMYPGGLNSETIVNVDLLAGKYCGKSRPGHFAGVTTVVSKLFNIVQPDFAVFGLKDYQQYLIITKMVKDLNFPIKIIGVETQRDSSGLAMSSRNNYLDATQRDSARIIFQCLSLAAESIRAGSRNFRELESQAQDKIRETGFNPEYFAICRADTLAEANDGDTELVILTAAYAGSTRLIDNLRLNLLSG